MVHVKVAGMSLSNLGFVVLLKGDPDPRTLPIFIGGAEAQSIALWLEQVKIPRPLTHDLFKNVLDCMECRLKRVVIRYAFVKEGMFESLSRDLGYLFQELQLKKLKQELGVEVELQPVPYPEFLQKMPFVMR